MSRTSMADINVYLKLVWMVKNESDGHEQWKKGEKYLIF